MPRIGTLNSPLKLTKIKIFFNTLPRVKHTSIHANQKTWSTHAEGMVGNFSCECWEASVLGTHRRLDFEWRMSHCRVMSREEGRKTRDMNGTHAVWEFSESHSSVALFWRLRFDWNIDIFNTNFLKKILIKKFFIEAWNIPAIYQCIHGKIKYQKKQHPFLNLKEYYSRLPDECRIYSVFYRKMPKIWIIFSSLKYHNNIIGLGTRSEPPV